MSRQSLNDAINELKIKNHLNKSKTPSTNSTYTDKWKQCYLEKRTNIHNIQDLNAVLPPLDNNMRKNSYHSNSNLFPDEQKSAFQEITTKNSIFSASTNDIRVLKSPSIPFQDNSFNKSSSNIQQPNSTSNSVRKKNPRFSTKSTPAISITIDTEEDQNPPISPKPPSKSQSHYKHRVHFTTPKKVPSKKHLGEKYYRFGLRLMKEEAAKPRAAVYFRKAADNGHHRAMIHYADMLYDGYKVGMDRKKARQLYNAAFLRGDTKVMKKFQPLLYDGDGVRKDKKEAARYYKLAADTFGDITAIRRYRSMLYDGDGIEKNREEAARYYKIEADAFGDVSSMCQYGAMLYRGDGVMKDRVESARYFRMAADLGDASAMRQLAYLMQTGLGVEKNHKEAVRYYKEASELGDVIATRQYAYMLYNGYGIKMNKKEAAKFYKIAADLGDAPSMCQYGEMLNKGDGVEMDKAEAAKYMKK